jgi:hypothetical protein
MQPLATFIRAFDRFLPPLTRRESLRCHRRSCLIFAANAFGFAQQVPSEQVASVLMPTSPPSTLL